MKTQLTLVFALLLSFFALPGHARQNPLPPLASTSGVGEVKVKPDQISFTTGVEIREKSLEDARRLADQRTAALITFLKKSGVDEKYIQTTHLSLYPVYGSAEYGQSTPQSYQATRSITVLLTKLDRFDEIMSGLYKAGANRVDGINYLSSQLKKHQEEARKAAVQDARQKAVVLASELGVKVGRPYQISEGGNNGPRPMAYKSAMRESMAMDAGGTTIAPGEMIISAAVDVSFLLE